MDASFGHWLAGFTDGEGCFTICRVTSRNGNPHLKTWPGCRFQINLRADDMAILVKIRDTLGFGNVRAITRSKVLRPGEKDQGLFAVSRIADCLKIVDFFEQYPLRAKKAVQFELWKKAVYELSKGRERDDDLMREYQAQLAELRQYVAPSAIEAVHASNPAAIRHHRDYGTPPLCLCGCGVPTKLVAHPNNLAHPDNPSFCRFLRGHWWRMRSTPTTNRKEKQPSV